MEAVLGLLENGVRVQLQRFLADRRPSSRRRLGADILRGNKQIATAESAAKAGGSSGRRMAGFNERWDAKEKALRASALAPRHAGHISHTGIEQTPRGEGRNLRNYEPAPVQVWPIASRWRVVLVRFPTDQSWPVTIATIRPAATRLTCFGAPTPITVAMRSVRAAQTARPGKSTCHNC